MFEFLHTWFFGMKIEYTVMAVDCYNGEYFTKNDVIRVKRENYQHDNIISMIKEQEFNDHHCEVIEVKVRWIN